MYPRIYLAIDNCVFYKRWTRPDEWAEKIFHLGLRYIEASADTELDPLYMGKYYLRDWVESVRDAEQKYGVKGCNLYSGQGTYTTLGLALMDEFKSLPSNAVWDYCCLKNNVPTNAQWLDDLKDYESTVMFKR